MNRTRCTACLLAAALTAACAQAQNEVLPMSTGSANFLTLPADARTLGMGGSGVALSGTHAVFSNASTAVYHPGRAGVAYGFAPVLHSYEPGHALHSVAAFYRVSPGNAVTGGFRYYRYPEAELSEPGLTLRPKEWCADLGYVRELLPHWAASVTGKWIHSDMGSLGGAQAANVFAVDLGTTYRGRIRALPRSHWAVGLQVANIGKSVRYLETEEVLPTIVRAGGMADIVLAPEHRMVASADVVGRVRPSDARTAGLSAGIEYSWNDCLKLRGGGHFGNDAKGDADYATLGGGIRLWGIEADFAWLFAAPDNAMDGSWWFTVGCSF